MFLVAIDPGHGGHDPGAVSDGVAEKDIVLGVGQKVNSILKYWPNYRPFLIRQGDEYLGLQKRAMLANQNKANIFISIHTNAFYEARVHGTESFHFPGSVQGKRLASIIQEELLTNVQRQDRGVKEARFTVLARTVMPAVLVELGFLTAEGKPELMQTEHFQWLSAVGICHGIKNYFEEENG